MTGLYFGKTSHMQAIGFRRASIDQLSSSGEQSGKFFGLSVGNGPNRWTDGLCKTRQNIGVESIVFCESAGGFGEISHFAGIEDDNGKRGSGKFGNKNFFITARSFESDQCGCRAAQARDELTETCAVGGKRKLLAQGTNTNVKRILGHIDPYNNGVRHERTLPC